MEREAEVLSKADRDRLFSRLREEPRFREMMKKDWRAALKEVSIDPDLVVKGTLSREEVENLARQRAGWTITIVISALGLERIEMNEAVNFAVR